MRQNNAKSQYKQWGSAPDDELEEEVVRKDHQDEVEANCAAPIRGGAGTDLSGN